jgi:cytochrome c553
MYRMLSTTIGAVALLGLISTAQAAGDIQAGKAKAATCVACHGAAGQGIAPNPPLAGMPEDRFVQAMQDYKSGKRPHALMKGLASSLSDQDITNLAAYYASLK